MNYNFNWTVIEKNIVPMLEGLGFGLLMAIIAITVGTIIGLLLAFAAVSKSKIARKLVQIFVTIFRNTPILILVYITYFGMPTIGINIPKVPSFVITLALYSSAYMEEVFRAGLEAIPKGIIEAGLAIGLTFPQIFFNILLPQAVVQMIPPWINSATEMIKASTLLGMIGVLDLLLVTRQIVAKYGEALVYYLIIGVFYFAINTLIEYAGKKLSKKLNYLQKAKR